MDSQANSELFQAGGSNSRDETTLEVRLSPGEHLIDATVPRPSFQKQDSDTFTSAKSIPSRNIQFLESLQDDKHYLVRKLEAQELKYRCLEVKYSALLLKVNELKEQAQEKVLNATVELKLKKSENERLDILLCDMEAKVADSKQENVELKSSFDDLKIELLSVENKHSAEIKELSAELSETKRNLSLYENIENAIDQAVKDATPDTAGEVVGLGGLLPTSASRRLSQALEQTMRANKLEAQLETKKNELFELYDAREALREEIRTLKSLMAKPVSSLIQTICEKDTEISKLNNIILQLQKKLEKPSHDDEFKVIKAVPGPSNYTSLSKPEPSVQFIAYPGSRRQFMNSSNCLGSNQGSDSEVLVVPPHPGSEDKFDLLFTNRRNCHPTTKNSSSNYDLPVAMMYKNLKLTEALPEEITERKSDLGLVHSTTATPTVNLPSASVELPSSLPVRLEPPKLPVALQLSKVPRSGSSSFP